tara:strand:+ start:213 stop:860 length:648 start_codon:yes stop_codon:yes gene_type:complete
MTELDKIFGNRESIFLGETEFKPCVRYGIIIPDYYIAQDTRVLSTRCKKHKFLTPKGCTKSKRGEGAYLTPPGVAMRVHKNLFTDFNYTANTAEKIKEVNDRNMSGLERYAPHRKTNRPYKKRTKSTWNVDTENTVTINVHLHRLMMEVWHPLRDHSSEIGISKEEWNSLPKSVQTILEHCVIIDHIDANTKNNLLSNLRWVTPKENNYHRKSSS